MRVNSYKNELADRIEAAVRLSMRAPTLTAAEWGEVVASLRGPVEQGWKLMPPEPTPEMLDADYKAACWYVIGDGVPQELKDHDHGQALVCYRAVFAAAPSPSATQREGEPK